MPEKPSAPPPREAPGHAPRHAPRIVLVTGVGGSGRTTVAAATALGTARRGSRTLLLSTAEDEVLDRILGATVPAGEPAEAAPGLWTARSDPDGELRALAAALRTRGGALLEFTGAEPLNDDELTPLPGAAELALLRAVRTAAADGQPWDTVVVDLPPVARALRTLALPAQMHRYLDRLLPPQKQAARALRPLLAELAGVPMPAQGLYRAADRFRGELTDVQALLTSERTSVRLVAEPGPLALEPLRTARAALALYGIRLESVVANRLLPAGAPDSWLAGPSGEQQAALDALRNGNGCAAPPRVRELPHLGRSPRGADELAELAEQGELAVPDGPAGEHVPHGRVEDRLAAEGRLHWRLPLPGARKETLGLLRRGDELVVGVGPHRRTLPLPSALRRCRVTGAAFEEGELRIRFEPEPGLWPSRPDRP